MEAEDTFESPPIADAEGQFVLNLTGFEGPIDVLLRLAREQKLDLAQISILELADQYLDFIVHARKQHLEIAADYLVHGGMARLSEVEASIAGTGGRRGRPDRRRDG